MRLRVLFNALALRGMLVTFSLLIAQATAQAQSAVITQTADTILEGWADWIGQNGITEGAIAISHDGKIIAETGINRTTTDPAPVASLSKAITAICALKAMEDYSIPHGTRIPQAMEQFFSRYRAKDRRLFGVTLGHLITHDSGIHSKFEQRYKTFRSFEDPQKELQMRMIALERLGSTPGRSNYRYSNANYLALGLFIEETVGEDYEPYCKRNVLEPAGINDAYLSTDWAVMSSYGGWVISARDYLTFLNHYFREGLILGRAPTRFQPRVHIGNNRYYGPGVLYRKTDKGTLIWHAGSWRWKDKTRDAAFGAYFLMLDDGLAIVTNFNDDAGDGALEALERMIWDRTHP